MCQHAEEHSHPESVHDISGTVLRLRGDESPPLAGTRGSHFVFPVPFQARQLCSFEGISEAAGTHGIGFSGMSSGLITHAPVTAMAEISSFPGLGSVRRGAYNGRIDSRLGSSVRGNASFRTVVGASEPVAHKPLGAGSSLLSSK